MSHRCLALVVFAALALAGCSDLPRATGEMDVTYTSPAGVTKRASFDVGSAVLDGCSARKRLSLETPAFSLPQVSFALVLDGETARLTGGYIGDSALAPGGDGFFFRNPTPARFTATPTEGGFSRYVIDVTSRNGVASFAPEPDGQVVRLRIDAELRPVFDAALARARRDGGPVTWVDWEPCP